MISTNSPTESRESYYMGDPWSDNISYTFDDYRSQPGVNPFIINTTPDTWNIGTTPITWNIGTSTPTREYKLKPEHDSVNHPKHYTSHPSGVECIQVTQHYNFCVGNAIKYLWRAGLKTEGNTDSKQKQIEDLNKACWYIRREIENLETGKYEQT